MSAKPSWSEPKTYVIEVRDIRFSGFKSIADLKREERKFLRSLDGLIRKHLRVGLRSKAVISYIKEEP